MPRLAWPRIPSPAGRRGTGHAGSRPRCFPSKFPAGARELARLGCANFGEDDLTLWSLPPSASRERFGPAEVILVRVLNSLFSDSNFSLSTASTAPPDPVFPLPYICVRLRRKRGRKGSIHNQLRCAAVAKFNAIVLALNVLSGYGGRHPASYTKAGTRSAVRHLWDRSLLTAELALASNDDGGGSPTAADFTSFGYHLGPALSTPRGGIRVGELVQLKADNLALPQDGGGTVHFAKHVVTGMAMDSLHGVLREPPPTPAELAQVRSYKGWAPGQYPGIIKALCDAGCVELRSRPPVVVNGLFGVAKSAATSAAHTLARVIVDARKANCHFRTSQGVQLPTPSAFSDILMEGDGHLLTASCDVSAMFHRLHLPPAARPYFGLPSVWSTALNLAGEKRMLYPVCASLPMGFALSVEIALGFIGLVLVLFVAKWAVISLVGRRVLVLTTRNILHGTYVDDNILIGMGKEPEVERLNAALDDMSATLNAAGLLTKASKELRAGMGRNHVQLGVLLHHRGLALPAPGRARDTLDRILHVLRHGAVSSRQVLSILGSLQWYCLLNRPTLSIFDTVYMSEASDELVQLSGDAQLELALAGSLLPLMGADLRRPFHSLVFATDASLTGQGIVSTTLELDVVKTLANDAVQRGWFTRLLTPADEDDAPPPCTLSDTARHVLSSSNWSTLVATRWQFPVYITEGEVRALLTLCRRISATPALHNHRFVVFCDSHATLGCLGKGRSSARTLNRLCRRIAGYLLASNTKLYLVYTPSELNPADEPSRR